MFGTLCVICGPMFSGKTSALVSRIGAIGVDHPVLVMKPTGDVRYALDALVTHDGATWPAIAVRTEGNVRDAVTHAGAGQYAVLDMFFDEVQFMDSGFFVGNFVTLIGELLADGHRITCAGLDMDYRGRPFEVTANLLAMADHVEKLKARCAVSGAPASKTMRRSDGGERIVLGAADIYEARSNAHWSVVASDPS